MPRTGNRAATTRQSSGNSARARAESAGGTARSVGQLAARTRGLAFRYELATGRWSVQSTATPAWHLDAVARVRLIRPDGQVDERAVTSAALVSCREEPPGEGGGRGFEVWRAWPDGLAVGQRFVLDSTHPELTTELTLRPPPGFHEALEALTPLGPVAHGESNFQVTPEGAAAGGSDGLPSWRILDLGWTAGEAARVVALGSGATVEATGLAALSAAEGPTRLTLGFLEASEAVGRYRFVGDNGGSAGIAASAGFGIVDLGARDVTSGPLWLSAARVEDSLARFVAGWQQHHPPGRQPPTIVQWQPKRPDHERPSETGVLDRLAAAIRWFGAPTLDVATVSPSWKQSPGDWIVDPARFPDGLCALSNAIRGQDLRAGVCLAPFLVKRSSRIYQEHPTWVVRSPAGDPIPVEASGAETFALDLTQPAVLTWIRELGERIQRDWGFGLLQADDLDLGVMTGWRASGTTSPIAAFREGLNALREALGPAQIVAADAPLFGSLGLADAVLASREALWRADPAPLLRSFLSRTGTLLGPGQTSLNRDDQTLDEARAAATVACFGGGLVTLTGDLGTLPPERAEILRACIPPYNEGPVLPIEPCAAEGPGLFGCQVTRRFDDWFVLIALNPASFPVARVAPLAALGLPSGDYHAFEFWSQAYLGIVSERLVLERISPGGCQVVGLRRVRTEPQVVGTSLHATLGAVALQTASFDRRDERLHLAIGAAGDRTGTISVAMPRGWAPGPLRGTGGIFTLRQPADRIVEIVARFKDVAEIELEFWPDGNPQGLTR